MIVERVHSPTREAFEARWVSTGTPVVLTGVMDGWPAREKWTSDYLRRTVGHRTVHAHRIRGKTSRYAGLVVLDVRDYFDRLEREPPSGERLYCAADLEIHLPELVSDVRPPPYFDPRDLIHPTLFMGRDGMTPCHYHSWEQALHCVVTGRKRIRLYPPADSRRLYPGPIWGNRETQVDLEHVDFDRFPAVRETTPVEVELDAGEMLFIPIHWWHYARSVGDCVGVTYFWRASLRHWRWRSPGLGVRSLAAMLLSVRSNPASRRFVKMSLGALVGRKDRYL